MGNAQVVVSKGFAPSGGAVFLSDAKQIEELPKCERVAFDPAPVVIPATDIKS
jgi:hypothetical protein